MDARDLKQLPIGIQTFEKIINEGMLYVDKTEQMYQLTKTSQYVFLSRPRRFGKSLLVSTLQAYFEGKKHLFKDLWIDSIEKEWIEYPVLRFDMSLGKHQDAEGLNYYLSNSLKIEEDKWGVTYIAESINARLANLIQFAYEKTGKQVVVLIDEYDAPLLDIVHEEEMLPKLRNIMRNFYSPLKGCDPYIKFAFITGITKFSQLSIFSELNNIKNISMLPQFSTICGLTETEMKTQLGDYVDYFAEQTNRTREEVFEKLKYKYDGYHFTWPSEDIYNPFSLLNSLQDLQFKSYWFGSGTPTYLIEMLRKFDVVPSNIGRCKVFDSDFDAPTERIKSIIPILYQSGYITIKDYNSETERYFLDIPNAEIRVGLMESLLENYLDRQTLDGKALIVDIYEAVRDNDLNLLFSSLQKFLRSLPYCENTHYEGHYQQLLYVIFTLLGRYVDVEVRAGNGRVDIAMNVRGRFYLFELKMNQSAEVAMSQINIKQYQEKFELTGATVTKVAVNFSLDQHTITDWVIQ
ncbi:MAG: AAA family ATPase [Bacteroidia bacterium]|nr:AAA family ATPase [Bacteroidia bacterium]